MGNQTSNLRPEDIEELQKKCTCTHGLSLFGDIPPLFGDIPPLFVPNSFVVVTPKEIKRLYKRFQKLDRSGIGQITAADFMQIPELAMNPLVARIVALFDTRGDDHINFEQFLSTLSVFSPRADPKEKMRCALAVDFIVYRNVPTYSTP
jgi:hypothetical protein